MGRFLAAILLLLVAARSLVFVIWGHAHFDADQAILGLMAHDISRLHGLVLFFYGQKYLLGILDWLAAPLFLVFGPSVSALKAPLVAVNLLVVWLLLRHLQKDSKLTTESAALSALVVALPSVAITSRFVEAQGANIEAFLSILLLWVFRKHPIVAGVVAALGYLNREFTIYGVIALFVVEFPRSRVQLREFVARWTLGSVVAITTAWGALKLTPWSLNYFAAEAPPPVLQPLSEIVVNVKYFFEILLPSLFGALPQPLSAYNILSSLHVGSFAAGVAMTCALVAAFFLVSRQGLSSLNKAESAFPLYLIVTGLLAALGFILFRTGVRDLMCVRYVLLFVLLPVGAFGLAFRSDDKFRLRIVMGLSIFVWGVLNLSGHAKFWREYLAAPPVDVVAELRDALVAKNLRCGEAPYWTAYPLAFYGLGQLTIASSTAIRIPEFQDAVESCPDGKFSIDSAEQCTSTEKIGRFQICRKG